MQSFFDTEKENIRLLQTKYRICCYNIFMIQFLGGIFKAPARKENKVFLLKRIKLCSIK